MKIRKLLLTVLLAIATSVGFAEDKKPSWFEGMLHQPTVTLALPTNFIVVSASPQTKTTKEFNMDDGVIWAPKKTARQFEFGTDYKFSNATEPLFYTTLSEEVNLKPGTDIFSNEKNIVEDYSAAGMKNVKSSKIKWGNYPVLTLTAEQPDGLPFFVAWIGDNSPDGWTILVDYRVPKGKGHPTKDEIKIWETFLKETKPN